MTLQAFRATKQSSREIEELQTNIGLAFARLIGVNGNPVLDFSRITGVAVTSGSNKIAHKLNRQPRGWFWTDMTGAAVTLFRTAWSTTTITLTSSGTATVDFYFF